MNWKEEWKPLAIIVGLFLACYYLPVGSPRFDNAVQEAFQLTKWYAREHVLLCLIPAFFIAGGISVFVSQASVMKYLGARANKLLAYGVASVSGTILAVCSCTVLPLFAGIYKMGAGLGPATAFLYSGPAISVLAIVLTARILGFEIGVWRAAGAVVFSLLIGLLMHLVFRKEELAKAEAQAALPEPEATRPLWKTGLYFASMVTILVFANWSKPQQDIVRLTHTDRFGDSHVFFGAVKKDDAGTITFAETQDHAGRPSTATLTFKRAEVSLAAAPTIWHAIYGVKWPITAGAAAALGVMLALWFGVAMWKLVVVAIPTVALAFIYPHEPTVAFAVAVVGLSAFLSVDKGAAGEWFGATWTFAKQILPLLLLGVLVSGFLLGRPDREGVVPNAWITSLVGGNSLWANLFSAVVGAFMYFATLTEVPILQGLMGSGMGKGPALALLLAGPALSLPSMIIIRQIMGTKKTVVFVSLVVVLSTITGMVYGAVCR